MWSAQSKSPDSQFPLHSTVVVWDVCEGLLIGECGVEGFCRPALKGAGVGPHLRGGFALVWVSAVVGAGCTAWVVSVSGGLI